jgi:hypothetical protein
VTESGTDPVAAPSAPFKGIFHTVLEGNSYQWYNAYTYIKTNSANFARVDTDNTFQKNITILGNLSALGNSVFRNTIITTTSALSVINVGIGPALYVAQAPGVYDIANFYDLDGIEVLHVGNALTTGSLGKVGINTSFPTVEFTVNGAISSNNTITVRGGNSNEWNSNYSTTKSNSGNWNLGYNAYTTTKSNSANWNLGYDAYTNLINNSSAYLSGGTAAVIGFTPITNTNYFSARIEPLQLLETSVQSAISALNERINTIYALLEGLTANKGTVFVSISSTL